MPLPKKLDLVFNSQSDSLDGEIITAVYTYSAVFEGKELLVQHRICARINGNKVKITKKEWGAKQKGDDSFVFPFDTPACAVAFVTDRSLDKSMPSKVIPAEVVPDSLEDVLLFI